jgi:hypothetical protein
LRFRLKKRVVADAQNGSATRSREGPCAQQPDHNSGDQPEAEGDDEWLREGHFPDG